MKKEVASVTSSIGSGLKFIVVIFISFGILLNDKCNDLIESFSNPTTSSTTVKKAVPNDRTEIYRKHLEAKITALEKENKLQENQLEAYLGEISEDKRLNAQHVRKITSLKDENAILKKESKIKSQERLELVKDYNSLVDKTNSIKTELTSTKKNHRKTKKTLDTVRTQLANVNENAKILRNNFEYQKTVLASLREEIAIINLPFYKRAYFWLALLLGIALASTLHFTTQSLYRKEMSNANFESKNRRLPLYAIMDKAASFLL